MLLRFLVMLLVVFYVGLFVCFVFCLVGCYACLCFLAPVVVGWLAYVVVLLCLYYNVVCVCASPCCVVFVCYISCCVCLLVFVVHVLLSLFKGLLLFHVCCYCCCVHRSTNVCVLLSFGLFRCSCFRVVDCFVVVSTLRLSSLFVVFRDIVSCFCLLYVDVLLLCLCCLLCDHFQF